jgi:hypothetical protein
MATTTPQNTKRNFKGGSVINERIETVPSVASPPIGIKTPLRKANRRGQLFDQHFDLESDLIDNFKNLLLTNYGERLVYPSLGANLVSLFNERTSLEDWNEKATSSIVNVTRTFMPQISIDNIGITELPPMKDGFSRIKISVNFSIQRLGIQGRQIDLNITNAS